MSTGSLHAGIAHARLIAHHLSHAPFTHPADAVAHMGAMQGQDYLGALWAVGLRTQGATEASVEAAVAEGRIVRLWFMRGTLHLLAAPDVRWMMRLLRPRLELDVASDRRYGVLALDDGQYATVLDAWMRLLDETRQPATRDELIEAAAAAGVPINGRQLSALVQRAQVEGCLCYGMRRGKQVTYAHVDHWIPDAAANAHLLDDPEAAAAELVRRYFVGHGPATEADFARWTGLTLTQTRAGLGAVARELAADEIDGQTYWRAPHTPSPRDSAVLAEDDVFLLSGFDEYVLGYRDRSAVMDPQYEIVWSGRNAVYASLLLAGGQVVGTWTRALKTRTVSFAYTPFQRYAPLSHTVQAAIAVQAARYAAFVGKVVG